MPSLRRRQQHPTPVLLPGKSHGQRSLVGCSPWGCEESDTTERLHFHSSLSCIGEGNSDPLQCSCLENPRDSGAWWAAVYGVAQSQTRLKRLSSNSSSLSHHISVMQLLSSSPVFTCPDSPVLTFDNQVHSCHSLIWAPQTLPQPDPSATDTSWAGHGTPGGSTTP